MEVLYSSNELRDAINRVLASPAADERRVALVAYVSGRAQEFLPDPKGLEIVCWLQPGSTDHLTLRRLRERGARIYQSERMHMKVYWSSRRGCVICSANASGGALGGGTQKESGVYLPPTTVDIQILWEYADPNPVEDHDLERLEHENQRPPHHFPGLTSEPPPDFLEWRRLFRRSDWKLGAWVSEGALSKNAAAQAQETYGVKEPFDYLYAREGELNDYDWVLSFRLPGVTYIRWMKVDFVVPMSNEDEEFYADFPFQAVQVHRPNSYRPPFKLDSAFCEAFKNAIRASGMENLADLRREPPPERLLTLIEEAL